MFISGSQRLGRLGSAIFAEVGAWKNEAAARGLEVIDLGIGSPDRPPSARVMAALAQAVQRPDVYGYPSSEGSQAFRETVARWFTHRFGVALDPAEEIVALMGSQDGLSHLALSITDPGDLALVPDPGYPIYAASLELAGVQPYFMPLTEPNGFLPRLDEIPQEVADQAKFILLNYPSNPLAAVAEREFFERLVAFARKHRLLIVHDMAYSEMAFDGFRPISIFEIEGAKDIAVEFHSLSKSFNMAGCRIAFMVGQKDAVKALRVLKSNIDYGVFNAVQEAGIAALEEDMEQPVQVGSLYERRRDVMIAALAEAGWNVPKPKATMFLWARVPSGWTSRQISREMLMQAGVVVIPGDAFGPSGEGYVRIALVQEEEKLVEAAQRIGRFFRDNGIG
ncbi:aminotransferase class I/II-fold pyridoxal phosphate-dependent enzyme [Paenibacillus sp. y28]|uniref:aminotransferase class I/II-fold pyridoxal phosphate-dependent enzyme n=1 Tax=Paenibacillus sp. y28 TaxID=3129110 RepID=UPI00301A41C7